MMCLQGPLVLHVCNALVTQMLYFSKFSHICSLVYADFFNVQMYLILNIDICSLLVGIDCVAMKPEWKLYFLEWKTHSFVLNLVLRKMEIAF